MRAERRANHTAGVWWPALDGLRGLAVAAVLVYHHRPGWLPGGFLGVSLFFTLSGFLITTLLLREHDATGTISLRGFWVRRARRLVPVALAGLLLAALVAWFTRPSSLLVPVATDLRAAALNVANWRQVLAGADYGDAVTAPSPVLHYWSLAIEEQFYLLYPMAALAALWVGRRGLAGMLVAATGLSLIAQQVVSDPNRAYLGTDTRLAELTVGALLAVVLHSGLVRRRRNPRRASPRVGAVDLAGGTALIGLGIAWATVTLGDERLFRGGLLLHAAATAVVVLAAVQGRVLPALLSWPPLVHLGLVSYGVYVVHFPLYLLFDEPRVGIGGVGLLCVRVAVSLVVAVALHHLVEQPVRRGGAVPGWQGAVALATSLAVVLLLATAVPHVGRTGSAAEQVAAGLASGGITLSTMPAGPPPAAVTTTTLGATATTLGATTTTLGATTTTPARAVRPLRLLVVGDSTAVVAGQGLQQWATGAGAIVDSIGVAGCTFSHDGVVVVRPGWVQTPARSCDELMDRAAQLARERRSDAIIVFIGSIQLGDWIFRGEELPRAIGDPDFDQRYLAAAHAGLEALEGVGVPVLMATVPTPDWDPTATFPGATFPGSGPLTINDATRAAALNDLDAILVAAHPRVRRFAWAELISAPDGTVDDSVRPDGMHVLPERFPGLMAGGLEELLRSAYREVPARGGASATGPTRWSPDV